MANFEAFSSRRMSDPGQVLANDAPQHGGEVEEGTSVSLRVYAANALISPGTLYKAVVATPTTTAVDVRTWKHCGAEAAAHSQAHGFLARATARPPLTLLSLSPTPDPRLPSLRFLPPALCPRSLHACWSATARRAPPQTLSSTLSAWTKRRARSSGRARWRACFRGRQRSFARYATPGAINCRGASEFPP